MAITLRLTESETAALRRAAEAQHRSMEEVARTAIAEYIERRRVQRRDSRDTPCPRMCPGTRRVKPQVRALRGQPGHPGQ